MVLTYNLALRRDCDDKSWIDHVLASQGVAHLINTIVSPTEDVLDNVP